MAEEIKEEIKEKTLRFPTKDGGIVEIKVVGGKVEVYRDGKKEKVYYYGTGGRKTSSARVFLKANGSGKIIVNGKDYKEYFYMDKGAWEKILQPFKLVDAVGKFDAIVKVRGGGTTGQSEAIRHGIAIALSKYDESYRKKLRDADLVTRDARQVERKKYGLVKARKAKQYSKR